MEEGTALKVTRRIILLIVAVVFLVSGLAKVADPHAFLRDIENFRAFPSWLAVAGAYYIPWFELVCAVGLLIPKSSAAAARLILVALTGFTILLGIAGVRGLDITCGCFGEWWVTEGALWPIVRNIILITALGFCIVAQNTGKSAKRIRTPGSCL